MVFEDKNPNEEGDDSYTATAEEDSRKSAESSEQISSIADLRQSGEFPPTGSSNSSEDVGREIMDHRGFEIPGVLDARPSSNGTVPPSKKSSRAVDEMSN